MLAHRTELQSAPRDVESLQVSWAFLRHCREYSQLDTGSFVRQGDGNNLTAPWESC